jgi:two-component system, OmpR family, sensor kinase
MPISKKITLWYVGLLVVLTLGIGAAATMTMYLTLIASIDRTLEDTADEVIRNSRSFHSDDAEQQIGVRLPELDIFRMSGVYVQVWQLWDGGGLETPRLAASSTNLGNHTLPLDAIHLSADAPMVSEQDINGVPHRVLTRPVWLAQGEQFGNVQVAASVHTVKQAIQRLWVIMAAGASFSVLMAMLLGMLVSRMALRPLRAVTLAAASIADTEDLRTRIQWQGPKDELGQLASVFNHMMDRLEHLFSVQRRFVADVSHELRTPLTSIRGNIEIIKRYGMDQEAIDAIDNEANRMARLVNDLLMLARADNGELKITLTPTDLDTIVSEVYRESKVLAKDRPMTIRMGQFQPLRVNGDGDRLKQLLLNLVSNAIKFTPDGGTITLHLYEEAGQACVQVVDTGIGIKSEDLERIFDRFFQADTSRVYRGDSSAGLGLSIVKWIADAHDGTITAESEVGKGTAFTLLLPLLDPPLVHRQQTRRSVRLLGQPRGEKQPEA